MAVHRHRLHPGRHQRILRLARRHVDQPGRVFARFFRGFIRRILVGYRFHDYSGIWRQVSKGPVKIYRVPRPGFGKNLPEKKSSPPFF